MQDQQYQLPVEIDPLIGMLSFMTVKESAHTCIFFLHTLSSYMHEMIFFLCVDLCLNPAPHLGDSWQSAAPCPWTVD